MKAPTYGAQKVQQQAIAPIRANVQTSAEDFGASNAPEAFGRAAGSIADTLKTAADSANSLANKGHQNAFDTFEVDQHDKDKNGAFTSKGMDAVTDAPDRMYKNLDELKNGLMEKAPNQEQRDFINLSYEDKKNSLRKQMLAHSDREYADYDKGVTAASQSTNETIAVLNYKDPERRNEAMRMGAKAIYDYADRQNMNKAQADELVHKSVSDTSKKIVQSFISANDIAGANHFFETNKENFYNADDVVQVNGWLKESKLDKESTAIADKITKEEGYTDISAATERVKEMDLDPDKKSAVMTKLKENIAIDKHREDIKYSTIAVDVSNHIEKGGSLESLPKAIVGALTPSDKEAFQSRREQILGIKKVPSTNVTVYAKYDNMGMADFGKVSMGELITKARPNLTDDQWNSVRDKWEAAQGKDDNAKDNAAKIQNEETTLFRAMQEAKIAKVSSETLKSDMSKEQNLAYQKLQFELKDKLLLWSKQNGGKDPDSKTTKELVDDVVKQNALSIYTDGFWGTKEKTIAELKPDDKVLVPFEKIPKEEVTKMLNVLNQNNQLKGLDLDAALGVIQGGQSQLGNKLRKRMELAWGQRTIGNYPMMKQKLLGQ